MLAINIYKKLFTYRIKIDVSCLTKQKVGKIGESITVYSLKKTGCVIHETNHRIGRDEFDVICLDPLGYKLLVYEVKTKVIRETGFKSKRYMNNFMYVFHEKQLRRFNYKKVRAFNRYGSLLLAGTQYDQVSVGFSSVGIMSLKGESASLAECLISVALIDNLSQYL